MIIKVLLIEDNPGDRDLIAMYLNSAEDKQYSLVGVPRISEAYEKIGSGEFDLALLDLTLPDTGGGLETVRNFLCEVPNIPLVVLTGNYDVKFGLEAVKLGAQDYLVKGEFDTGLLCKTIDYSIERHRLLMALKNLALIDGMTNLYNRNGFMTLGEQKFSFALRQKLHLTLLFIDLDNLKFINDNYGHDDGDLALVNSADILRQSMRGSDLIARIGGDEFVVLAFTVPGENSIEKRIEDKISKFNTDSQKEWRLSMSIGLSSFGPEDDNIELKDLIQTADERMYLNKQKKKGL